ncbi:Ubiquitin carboxyl-terminal hydrolase [Wickerhamomyces ciferrii]|uniref:Ubiquitin carboxyl-terminal hydrolase n=1 Tax=Wickerhamomyces ciferrii (strain ATCC 14091 / BCRC 22168 / CBS 111 / JCM 3599 / NBRC 0793 / NRRL Y-1031 F-60-10) TaxID=1206466 RepID=K0KGK9_WICCF|nr:Ubiquitin carboxyl-terminal hydrolase [Wickerhamomyces ciferrii]CCH41317.1 Ubiquitin carboxyl-terminal hydrolase [Wickerhamomyces ciferrii]
MPQAVIPLESNPEIFTTFAHKLGLTESFVFHDVYSLTEPELLSFISRPSPAVILLFPVSPDYNEAKKKEESSRELSLQDEEVVWYKQTIRNACGLYALLNSISNLQEDSYEPNSKITEFKKIHKDISKIEELIANLENDYKDAATSGSTEAPNAEDEVDLHFIAFIKKNGHVYELDGGRKGPLDLGESNDPSSDDVLGEPKVVERFQRYNDLSDEKNKLNFSLIALAPSFD